MGKVAFLADTSADGTVAVGEVQSHGNSEGAVVWTREDGLQPLSDMLIANGAIIPAGWTLVGAAGISADGRWVAGTARNPDGFEEAFLADIRSLGSSGGGSVDILSLVTLSAVVCWRIRRQRSI